MNTTKTRPISQTPGHKRVCGCDGCRTHRNRYARFRERHIAYGTWQPRTQAEPVRAHIRDIMKQGGTLRRIAAAAACDHGYLGRVLWGRRGEPDTAHVSTEIADRILAVTIDQVGIRAAHPVDPTGTLRRLRALHASGRPLTRIARDLDRNHGWILQLAHGKVVVTARVAEEIAEYYDRVKNVTAEDDGVARRLIKQSRAHAARLGWEPPTAWDDDIDDPETISNFAKGGDTFDHIAVQRALKGQQVPLTKAEQLHVTKVLTLDGWTEKAIAALTGRSDRTIGRWRRANGWKAAA